MAAATATCSGSVHQVDTTESIRVSTSSAKRARMELAIESAVRGARVRAADHGPLHQPVASARTKGAAVERFVVAKVLCAACARPWAWRCRSAARSTGDSMTSAAASRITGQDGTDPEVSRSRTLIGSPKKPAKPIVS